MRATIFWLALCLLMAGCKTTEETLKESGKKPLASSQIQKLYSGKTALGTSDSSGRSYQVKFNSDGTAMLDSGTLSEPGKWWVEGKDIYCSQWTTVRDGAKRCLRIYDLGEKYQSVDMEGYASSTFILK